MTNGRRLFGTDGIRGTANEPPMTPELALSLGRAVTFVARPSTDHTSSRFPSSGPHDCTFVPAEDAGDATASSFPW